MRMVSRDRTNEEWCLELKLPPPGCDQAVEDLRLRILDGLRFAFASRSDVSDALLEDIAQETLLRILGRLESFRGESRFLTWSNKVAVRVALTELRRRRWKDVSLESFEHSENLFESDMKRPEQEFVQKELIGIVQETIRNDLTDRQRRALVAIMMQGMPMEEVARRMDTNRNSLYKLMHDARLRLKAALLRKGLSVEEIIDAFG